MWDYEQVSSFHYGPGLLSTAGGLIFAPEQQGMFTALDAKTGKALWNFNTGALITAAPIDLLGRRASVRRARGVLERHRVCAA